MKNDFDSYIERKQSIDNQAKEIISSRVGGLGGSDAALVYRVGLNGLSGLTAADNKRLSVMLGITPPDDWGGNKFTNSGHLFEDYIYAQFPDWEREVKFQSALAKTFTTFAHADFVKNGNVAECKFVTTKTTASVRKTYEAQLQWYYLLGANTVSLVHGTGNVEDKETGTEFFVKDIRVVQIERDEAFIKVLIGGIKTLDEAIARGWKPSEATTTMFNQLPELVKDAYNAYSRARELDDESKALKAEAKDVIMEYFGKTGYSSINGNDGHKITSVKAKMSKRFDLKELTSKLAEQGDDHTFALAEILKLIDESYVMTRVEGTIVFK